MAISQRQSEVVGDQRLQRGPEGNDPEYLCLRCGGARVEFVGTDRSPAYACPNCRRTHTIDGERYEPPEVRQYSHRYSD
ncbi:hypothetical protein [Natronoarchaeum rubrum]|uniref:hypothetical protein n=1 Tax=Natronoarchaeum rubrum TaxID=755311 RepID=UPI002113886A|nr:hypothetical protein [Natronoarchaeum rubrum]